MNVMFHIVMFHCREMVASCVLRVKYESYSYGCRISWFVVGDWFVLGVDWFVPVVEDSFLLGAEDWFVL